MIRRSIPRRRRGSPRRGRVLDPAFIAWCHENKLCAVKGLRAESPCVGRDTFHHIREFGSAKDDRRGFILCGGHHLHDGDPHSIEHGKKQFEEFFGISIEATIAEYQAGFQREVAA